jgi:L-seryl-tRNA(Ser) seleniumtransferase
MTSPHDRLRQLPAIDKLLQLDKATDLTAQYGHQEVVNALRLVLETVRTAILNDEPIATDAETILAHANQNLSTRFLPSLRSVINATGVIIHTNLGRALLSHEAQQAMVQVAANYNNLEFDLETGKRGSRYNHAEELLKELTGAEAALVVNNNAAALVLLLTALAQGHSAIVSRGQLVEIGGGFRIPDIMLQSGARLIEVGTTNRTRIADYAAAIAADTVMLMRIHSSNFRIIGFVENPILAELANLAHERGIYLVDDIGSGALLDTQPYGLLHEPTVGESIAAGADLVLFSGDKLLGGPQAGIIVGRKEIIQKLKQHPLVRALRADKLCYAALGATLDHYRKNEVTEKIPIWRMIAARTDELQARVLRWSARVRRGEVIRSESAVGGGSLPGTTLPTAVLAIDPPSVDEFAAKLRSANPPVIARIAEGRVLLDPRTVLPEQEDRLIEILKEILA